MDIHNVRVQDWFGMNRMKIFKFTSRREFDNFFVLSKLSENFSKSYEQECLILYRNSIFTYKRLLMFRCFKT